MGADIHVFVEYKDEQSWTPIEVVNPTSNDRIDPCHSIRDYNLFDFLIYKLPHNGSPKDPSSIFQKEWAAYSEKNTGGYGLNYILLSDLVNIFKEEEVAAFSQPEFYFSDFECSPLESVFNFVSNILAFLHIAAHDKVFYCRNCWDLVRIIYFFDR